MTVYALVEVAVVATLVGACAFALALRLLPTSWLKSPLGAWLDRSGRTTALRRIGARWRKDARSGCANGCCSTGDGCNIGRGAAVAVARSLKGIPIALITESAQSKLR